MSAMDVYDNPLISRYASREMAALWGPQRKFSTWRRLWVALAEAQQELGLRSDDGVTPRITPAQLAEMRAHVDDIDFAKAEEYERRFRHDVMAHIHAYGDVCPGARDIIHLGATSCYVTDNTDLLLMREGLKLLGNRLVGAIDALARFAERWRNLETLGFTHFQPAQLTTVGKRACLWCYDLVLDLSELERRQAQLRFRGVKGTTGTQASFLALFHGDHAKVRRLEQLVAHKMHFDEVYPVTGQTYSRKVDSQVLDVLCGVCQSATSSAPTCIAGSSPGSGRALCRGAGRLLSDAVQAQSHAGRRLCGLARFVFSLATSTVQTAATQWLERTLDDSVNRRLTLPQAFLATDGVLRLLLNIANGLVVNPEVVKRNVQQTFPYMASENILMAAVALGGDRQVLHEHIRQHSLAVTEHLKQSGARNDLLERLRADEAFAGVDFDQVLAEGYFVGRAPEQVDEFITQEIAPIRARYSPLLGQTSEVPI